MASKIVFFLTLPQARALIAIAESKAKSIPSVHSDRVLSSLSAASLTARRKNYFARCYSLTALGRCALTIARYALKHKHPTAHQQT